MPLYEFSCADCGARFEILVRSSTEPRCPACASEALERQLSTFAVGGTRSASPMMTGPSPCGTCQDPRGPGACRFDS